jgi:hypothetical protein
MMVVPERHRGAREPTPRPCMGVSRGRALGRGGRSRLHRRIAAPTGRVGLPAPTRKSSDRSTADPCADAQSGNDARECAPLIRSCSSIARPCWLRAHELGTGAARLFLASAMPAAADRRRCCDCNEGEPGRACGVSASRTPATDRCQCREGRRLGALRDAGGRCRRGWRRESRPLGPGELPSPLPGAVGFLVPDIETRTLQGEARIGVQLWRACPSP